MTRVRVRCAPVAASPPITPDLPVSIARIKAHARIVQAVEDDLLTLYAWAACQRFEEATDYRLSVGLYEGWLDLFPESPGILEIPLRPVLQVIEVRSYDTADLETTLATSVYWSDLVSDLARVGLKSGQTWPTGCRPANAGAVQIQAGFSIVPQEFERVIAQLAVAYWLNRGNEPEGLEGMLAPWRRLVLA